mmetsp:Transcript_13877/g.18199  ORF Transcript_13877/g.18199 Transcript_13877/m.18199 type:complete len:88 (-) Transcript_13877:33-296(-)
MDVIDKHNTTPITNDRKLKSIAVERILGTCIRRPPPLRLFLGESLEEFNGVGRCCGNLFRATMMMDSFYIVYDCMGGEGTATLIGFW